jgi:hypothetical protein
VTISAGTIARDLGSPCTRQKNGKERPTRLSTITKHLGDLASMGVCQRDEVLVSKVVTVAGRCKRRSPCRCTSTTPVSPSPALGWAAAERERKRCKRCFGEHLVATAYLSTTCGTTSTEAEARIAGLVIVQDDHGRFVHRETAEIVTPGVPVDNLEDVNVDCCGAECACNHEETFNRNPVTIGEGSTGIR